MATGWYKTTAAPESKQNRYLTRKQNSAHTVQASFLVPYSWILRGVSMLTTRGSKMEASKLILLIFTCILVIAGEAEAKIKRGNIDTEEVSQN